MSLKKELIIIIIIISILMAKIKMARGRIYEGNFKSQREVNKLNYHSLQTRHYNHYLHKKNHKCSLDRSYQRQPHVKKPSRYPTLDKIVHRLDNQIDLLDKLKMTTSNPLEEWNITSPPPTPFPDKADSYTYVTVGFKNGKTGRGVSKGSSGNSDDENVWITEDLSIQLNEDNIEQSTRKDGISKGFMQDHTTSSPWENEQHDINSHAEGSIQNSSGGLSTSLTLESNLGMPLGGRKKEPNLDKLPPWSIGSLIPRPAEEDRKEKTTPMPYVAAHAHYDQVLRMGDCHLPKEKVIRVHEVHPDPSKSYSPSCTILHQCGDDTGCCRDLKQVCKPKTTTKVELYFFTTTLGKPQTVEKLHFVNHTECECQKRTEEPLPRDSEFGKAHAKKHTSGKPAESKRKRNNCTCPSKYSARFLQNESCICDCFDKQDDCLTLKKGKTHFSYHDKLCIQRGICLLPSCEFGSYIRQFGRCPSKSEKYHYSWSRILSLRDLIT